MEVVEQLETERGRIVVRRARPGVLVSEAGGYMDAPFADMLIQVGTHENDLVPGFVHFMDWREVTGYTSEGRRRCTNWALRQQAPYPRLGILTSSKIVHMGVSAAAMALAVVHRELESFTDPAAFRAAVAEACRA
ncbi:MAG: hypothetical protein AB8I08_38695 [Sandaracinaceae bacterium]